MMGYFWAVVMVAGGIGAIVGIYKVYEKWG